MRSTCHLTTVHPPFDIRIFHRECVSLAGAGWQVTLAARHEKAGVSNGVALEPLPQLPNGRFRRFLYGSLHALRAARYSRARIIHFHDPELIPVGLLLKLMGRRVIYDVHEDLPAQTMSKAYLHPYVRGIVARLAALIEWIAAQAFDGFVVATEPIAKRFPRTRVAVVRNYALADEGRNAEPQTVHANRPYHAVYIGSIGENRGLFQMVGAVDRITQLADSRLVLLGTIKESDRSRAERMPGWSKCITPGYLSRTAVRETLATCRVGLMVLHPTRNYIESQPIKLFEYMAAGLPIIASDFHVWRQLIDDVGCGLLVDPLDEAAIAEAVGWLFAHPAEAQAMGRRGYSAVVDRYNWNSQVASLLDMYERVGAA